MKLPGAITSKFRVGYVKARAFFFLNVLTVKKLKMLLSKLRVCHLLLFQAIAVQFYQKGYFCTLACSLFHLHSGVDTSVSRCALAHFFTCIL